MRPSELRRRERRSWLGFATICLGCVLLVFVAAETSQRFFEPRWSPEEATVLLEDVEQARETKRPERAIAALGLAIVDHATTIQDMLGRSRSVVIEGATVFLSGGFELGDFVDRSSDGRERLLLVTWRPADPKTRSTNRTDSPSKNHGAVFLTVYERTGNTWHALEELFELPYDLGESRTESPLTAAGVTIRKAGEGVLAVDIPRRSRCDPAVTSDVERVRTVYATLFDSPDLIFEHASSGSRGNDVGERLRVQLTFSQRTREVLAGDMTIVRRYTDEAFPASWELPFTMRDGVFTLDGNPTTFFASDNRAVNDAIRTGDRDAEQDTRKLIDVLRTVGRLDGPLDFCVAMPHRVLAADTLDRERWRDRLEEHVFDIQLRLAGLLAERGRGMEALDVFGLDDPGLILNSSARRRELLDALTGPRLATLRYFPELEFDLRPRAARLDASTAVAMPLVWLDEREVIIPDASGERDQRHTPAGASAAALALHGALLGAAGTRTPRSLDPGSPAARAFVRGALLPTLDLRAAAGTPARAGALLAWHVRRGALGRVAAVARSEGIYTGHRYPVLDVVSATVGRTANWDELQALAGTQERWDQDAEGRTVVRTGRTCGGGFVQLCERACAQASLPVPDPQLDTDVETVKFELPGREVPPCYPAQTPGQTGALRFMGWNGNAVILRDANRWFSVDLSLDPPVASETRPVYPKTGPDPDAPIIEGWPWLRREPGLADRFEIAVDGHALWLHDLEEERDYLLSWWSTMPLGPPRDEVFTASIAPDGRHVVLWIRGEGTWVGQLSDLPITRAPATR